MVERSSRRLLIVSSHPYVVQWAAAGPGARKSALRALNVRPITPEIGEVRRRVLVVPAALEERVPPMVDVNILECSQ
ncbi:hypothetical protein NHX12_034039 [Muraenolepis orangiensis]|uniref:Uncharacterized protein n=1 Tax=Muraenolepis orangiensis TaxID=630683 RepID=A0A9Q0IGZ4_9TELE|nr:hypothetical protein NHX12_034039 [Muraenolepis orangiensis]